MIIDTSNGTCILGSNFGRLVTTYRDRGGDDYTHSVVGRLQQVDDWLILKVDDDIARYYASTIKTRFGINLHWRARAGTHVSVIRGEKLPKPELWGKDQGKKIKINYTHQIYTNGEHWWLNVECDELALIRSSYGLPTNKKWFHLTIGRL